MVYSVKSRLSSKRASGVLLIASAFSLYFLYQSGGGKMLFLPPIGIALFIFGFYLSFSGTNFYTKYRSLMLFMSLAVFMSWMAWDTGMHDYIVNSSYGSFLAGITIKFSVYFLNCLGYHVSNTGNQITFLGDSKVQSFDVINACSGADTTILFLSAFVLMLADQGRRASVQKLAVCFVCGAVGTYLVSIMRVPLLGIVGYYDGYGALETYHMYSGYLIFLGSIATFWYLSLRWINKRPRYLVASN
jgi:exosortase/archaeosortase family protein